MPGEQDADWLLEALAFHAVSRIRIPGEARGPWVLLSEDDSRDDVSMYAISRRAGFFPGFSFFMIPMRCFREDLFDNENCTIRYEYVI